MKQKRQIIFLIVLVAIAAVVWGSQWKKQTPSMQTMSTIENYKVLAVENPQIRWQELERAQKTEYKASGRNPFSVIAPPPAQDPHKSKPPVIPEATVPPPQLPPTEAKLPPNLKYFGYGTVPEGSPRRAFFTDGDDVYVVTEGDTLLGRYRILRVGNASLEFQEISSGLRGSTPLEEQTGSPSA